MFFVLDIENLINFACRTNIRMPGTKEDQNIVKRHTRK